MIIDLENDASLNKAYQMITDLGIELKHIRMGMEGNWAGEAAEKYIKNIGSVLNTVEETKICVDELKEEVKNGLIKYDEQFEI